MKSIKASDIYTKYAGSALFLFFAIAGVFILIIPAVDSYSSLLMSFDDDAFYYFKIAKNLADGHGSTFNGFYSTNGYHPLWMFLVVITRVIADSSKLEFLLLAKCLISFLYLCQLVVTYKLCTALENKRLSLSKIAYFTFSACFFILIAGGGMEVALTLPLLLLLFLFIETRANILTLSIVATLIVLSRLDSVLLIAPLSIYLVFSRHHKPKSYLAPLILMVSVIVAYTSISYELFGVAVPISGLAKSSIRFALFSTESWNSLFTYTNWKRINLFALCCLVALLTLLVKHRSIPISRFLFSMMLGVILFFATTAARSDWPMWPWYFYPIITIFYAGYFSITHGVDLFPVTSIKRGIVFGTLVISSLYCFNAVFVYPMLFKKDSIPSPILAEQLAEYMNLHPGRYAMGDRAGMVGYLSSPPLIQLEGLVMDKNYLQTLRSPDMTISKLMNIYSVDYYINFGGKDIGGCFSALEPIFGGPLTPKVSGKLCQEPIVDFSSPKTGQDGPRIFLVRSLSAHP